MLTSTVDIYGYEFEGKFDFDIADNLKVLYKSDVTLNFPQITNSEIKLLKSFAKRDTQLFKDSAIDSTVKFRYDNICPEWRDATAVVIDRTGEEVDVSAITSLFTNTIRFNISDNSQKDGFSFLCKDKHTGYIHWMWLEYSTTNLGSYSDNTTDTDKPAVFPVLIFIAKVDDTIRISIRFCMLPFTIPVESTDRFGYSYCRFGATNTSLNDFSLINSAGVYVDMEDYMYYTQTSKRIKRATASFNLGVGNDLIVLTDEGWYNHYLGYIWNSETSKFEIAWQRINN